MEHQVVKRAVWRDKNGNQGQQMFFLVRAGKGDYRWLKGADQSEFDGVSYLDEGSAIRAMRVFVDGDPSMVGIDLTIEAIELLPEQRAAEQIYQKLWVGSMMAEQHREGKTREITEIIQRETNIGPLITAFSELMAYVFKCRVRFAAAVTPPMPDAIPRDLTMDGLLLNAIEAIAKSTGQDLGNLTKILKQPVGQITVIRPKGSIQ